MWPFSFHFFPNERRLLKAMGPTTFVSLSPFSLPSKLKKLVLSSLFLSYHFLSFLFLFNQTGLMRVWVSYKFSEVSITSNFFFVRVVFYLFWPKTRSCDLFWCLSTLSDNSRYLYSEYWEATNCSITKKNIY